MSKNETAFWMILGSGILSAFIGTICGIIFFPAAKQFFGEYGQYISMAIGFAFALIIFLMLRYFALRMLEKTR